MTLQYFIFLAQLLVNSGKGNIDCDFYAQYLPHLSFIHVIVVIFVVTVLFINYGGTFLPDNPTKILMLSYERANQISNLSLVK